MLMRLSTTISHKSFKKIQKGSKEKVVVIKRDHLKSKNLFQLEELHAVQGNTKKETTNV